MTGDPLTDWTRAIWRSPLKGHVKIVALALALCADGSPSCSPSPRELRDLVCMGSATITEALGILEDRGYIEVDRDPEEVRDVIRLVIP